MVLNSGSFTILKKETMKTTDHNTNYENYPQETDSDFEVGNEEYNTIRIEEEYNGDTYNFFPDAAF